jgi:hypothetical protein
MTPLKAQKLARDGVLDASEEFKNATGEELNRICNGCGSKGALFDFVPDRIWGADISAACNIHDFDYEYGETKEAKKKADDRMLANTKKLVSINHKNNTYKPEFLMNARANLYYWSVKYFGKRSFWRGKN